MQRSGRAHNMVKAHKQVCRGEHSASGEWKEPLVSHIPPALPTPCGHKCSGTPLVLISDTLKSVYRPDLSIDSFDKVRVHFEI